MFRVLVANLSASHVKKACIFSYSIADGATNCRLSLDRLVGRDGERKGNEGEGGKEGKEEREGEGEMR